MNSLLRKMIYASAAAVAFMPLSAYANGSCAQNWNDVLENGKKEKTVRLYTSLLPSVVASLKQGFEAAYAGVKMEVVRNPSSPTIAKVDQERQANIDGADITAHTDMGWFADRAKANELLIPTGPSMKKWPEKYLRNGNAVVVVEIDPIVIAYNTTLAKPPKNYPDLLNPELTGRLALTELISPSAAAFYELLEKTYGKDFLNKLAAQKPRFYNGVPPATQAVASGEVFANAFTVPSIVLALKEQGATIDFAVPNPGIAAEFGAAVLNRAGRPNAACLLLDYMMSEKGQSLMNGTGSSASPLPNIKGSLNLDGLQIFDGQKYTPEVINGYRKQISEIFK